MSDGGIAGGTLSGGLSGAGAGFAVGGPVGAAIGGGVGLLSGFLSSSGASAAQDAYSQALKDQLAYAQQTRQMAMGYAKPTLAELRLQGQQLQLASTSLQRMGKIFEALDPSLLEAGKQVLQLQQGQNARIIQPYLQQRAEGRNQIIASLRANGGAGAEVGSAGIDALRKYDNDTALGTQQLQMQSLNSLMGVINGDTGATQSAFQQYENTLNNGFSQSNTLQDRMIRAIEGTGYGSVAGNNSLGGVGAGNQQYSAWNGVLKGAGELAGALKDSFGASGETAGGTLNDNLAPGQGFSLPQPPGAPVSTGSLNDVLMPSPQLQPGQADYLKYLPGAGR